MMNEVNKTMFIPLYGKAMVSRKKIILKDPMAEEIWDSQHFPLKGKSKSKWLCYNMAMRARMFDDWTNIQLKKNKNALVLHIGCGLDSRCKRIKQTYKNWYDCDFPDVLDIRKNYYTETNNYHMISFDASDPKEINKLPENDTVIVVFEGISMYLKNNELRAFFRALENKYEHVHVLMDVYTVFGAKASKYKNPINEVGVTIVYGIDNIDELLKGLRIRCKKEYTMTPKRLVDELSPADKAVFRLLFTGRLYRKIYRLFELEAK